MVDVTALAKPNDGCTLWFDTWLGHNIRPCCDAHDVAYGTGTTVQQFLGANVNLFECVWNQGAHVDAALMFAGVMTGGAVFFFFGAKSVVKAASKSK